MNLIGLDTKNSSILIQMHSVGQLRQNLKIYLNQNGLIYSKFQDNNRRSDKINSFFQLP